MAIKNIKLMLNALLVPSKDNPITPLAYGFGTISAFILWINEISTIPLDYISQSSIANYLSNLGVISIFFLFIWLFVVIFFLLILHWLIWEFVIFRFVRTLYNGISIKINYPIDYPEIKNKYHQRIPKKWDRLIIFVWVIYNFITFPLLGSKIWGLYAPIFNWITFQLLFIFILWGIVWVKEGFENNEK